MVDQERNRVTMHPPSLRGELIAQGTEEVDLRLQVRVGVEDQGPLPRMFPCVLTVTDVIRENVGW